MQANPPYDFHVLLDNPHDLGSAGTVPPSKPFPHGTTEISFFNEEHSYIMQIDFARGLGAKPNPLVLQPRQGGVVTIDPDVRGAFWCTTTAIAVTHRCPLCATELREASFLPSDSTQMVARSFSRAGGEPIIIID
jgi:hypothetical protein